MVTAEPGGSGVQRRLAAIAFVDVAGFSRLVGANDVSATSRWKRVRLELIEPRIAEHHGRLLRVIGDGLFVEFDSAVSAVRWATLLQQEFARREADESGEGLQVRIGINVEDVIVDDDDRHGDGVNIAARIQQLAGAGEVVVTAAVCEYVWNKLDVRFIDIGEHELKNISHPVRVYRAELASAKATAFHRARPDLPWSKRPSIAVLPFRNIGGNPDEDYFGEGITEEIIGNLARSRSLFVIARNSTLRYRDRQTDTSQIASELGVRYILDGSIRRQAMRLRISPQLIDVSHGRTIWAEKYEGANDELFEFQDSIASRIVATIEPAVYEAESERVRAKPTSSLDAYDCVLRALPLFHTFDNRGLEDAGKYLDKAIALDPSYAQAHAHRAWLSILLVAESRSRDVPAESALAKAHVQRALSLDPRDPFVLAVAGHVHALLHREPEVAADLFDRSLELNQSSAFAWGMSGLTYCYLGRPDEALDRFANVWELSPFDPLIYFYTAGAGLAEFLAGRYEQAIPWCRKALQVNPRFLACLRHLTTSLAHLNRLDEAQAAAAQLLALEPGFRVSIFASWYPLRPAENLERYVAGLRAAGLPD